MLKSVRKSVFVFIKLYMLTFTVCDLTIYRSKKDMQITNENNDIEYVPISQICIT